MAEVKYLVTGASGNVGSEVVAELLASGHNVKVFTRDIRKVSSWGDRAQVVEGSFQKPETLGQAITGVEAVFLMHQSPDQKEFSRLVAAAKASGQPRIVFLSSLLADQPQLTIGRLHKQKEDAIRESGLKGSFLRAGGFMSNTYQWIRSINAEGVIYNPLGNAKFPPIAPEDIAAVAVKSLVDPGLSGDVFELTGGELLSVPEQVDLLAKVLNRPIRCVDVPPETAVQNLIRGGVPAEMAVAVGESYQTVRNGRVMAVKDTVERVTERKPMTFEAWACKHASRFSATPTAQPASSRA